MHQAATTDAFLNHIRTKFGWHSNLYQEIDWDTKAHTIKNIPSTLKPWPIKLGTDRLPLLGEKFIQSPTILCPMCHLYKETTKHFLTYPYYPSETDQQTAQTIQVLQKVRLDPYLRILLRRVLKRQSCKVYDILQVKRTQMMKSCALITL